MSEKTARITITRSYRHPRTQAMIIHFKFDFGFRSNVNIPSNDLEGLSDVEAEAHILRTLEEIYERRKRLSDDADHTAKVERIASALKGREIE